MYDLRRKLLSLGNHFFERLKTANFSTACGTSTLKSPPSRGSDAPHVHPRLRKHLARCTLDCGFKTSESPALRGFVGGLRALATAALYLVLKSNGLRRSKNLPVKFGFTLKTVSANIAKKLPSQRWPQPLFIPLFNFSHKRPTFAFAGESGYTLGFRRRIAHSGLHAETRVFQMGVVSLPSDRSARSQTSPGRVSERRTLPLLGLGRGCSQRTQRAFGTAMRLCASLFRGVAAPLGCVICLQLGDVAVFFTLCAVLSERARWGWYHYPRSIPHVSETLRGQGVEWRTLPLLGLGWMYSRRTQKACGTAMRLCASLSRGVAAPLGCATLFAIW